MESEHAEYEYRMRHDPRPLEELVSAALLETDQRAAWDAVGVLHFRGTWEVFVRAEQLCRSQDPNERRLGADILGQLGVPTRAYPQECVAVLLEMVQSESDAGALQSLLVALGHLASPEAIAPAIRFSTHADPAVRHAAIYALMGHEDSRAINTLIELSRDAEAENRDWATFALGTQVDLDTPLRDALAERLGDNDYDTRLEALKGLAARKDRRAVAFVARELAMDTVDDLAIAFAMELADPELYPPLVALRQRRKGDVEELERAIQACSPSAR